MFFLWSFLSSPPQPSEPSLVYSTAWWVSPPATLGWPDLSANHPAAMPGDLRCHDSTALLASLSPSHPPVQSYLIPIVCKCMFSIPVSQVLPGLRGHWKFRSCGLSGKACPFYTNYPNIYTNCPKILSNQPRVHYFPTTNPQKLNTGQPIQNSTMHYMTKFLDQRKYILVKDMYVCVCVSLYIQST